MTNPSDITTSNEIKSKSKSILSMIDEMNISSLWNRPLSENIHKFFSMPTKQKSRRENYYQYSNYLAEYWCTLSNLGFVAVGCYYKDFATLAAATFSALSHATPLQRLHDLDMIAVACVLGKAICNQDVILNRNDVMAAGAAALAINVIDTILTRKHGDKIGPWLHVAWHIAAAIALGVLNQAQLDSGVTKEVIKNIR